MKVPTENCAEGALVEKSNAIDRPVAPGAMDNDERKATLDGSVTDSATTSSDNLHDLKIGFNCVYLVGGRYKPALRVEEHLEDYPVQFVDFDLPLTLANKVESRDDHFIVVKFVEGDPENPFNWSKGRKYYITSLLCLMTLTIGLATTAYSSTIVSMCDDLGCSTRVGQLGLFLFNVSCAFAPLFLAPFCELVGRKFVYVSAYFCFNLCFIGLTLGNNVTTILVLRLLLGLFGCVGTILVGGTFADMFREHERATPTACFSYVAIIGTVGAPIYAGFVNQALGWRWVEGIQGMVNIPLLIVLVLTFQETRGDARLKERARLLRKHTGNERYRTETDLQALNIKEKLHESSVKAIRMLFTQPVVFAFGLWIAFTWFLTFLFLSVVPITFMEKRGWNQGVSGLPWISVVIGVTLAFGAGFFQIRYYKRLAARTSGKVIPEKRLYGVMFGGFLLPVGLFLYAFTQYGYLPYIAPIISLAPIGAGIYFIFEATYSYTTDCYAQDSGSATAGQSFLRNLLGAISPLFAADFFHNLGSQYAGLLLAMVAVILTLIPYVFFIYGHRLRASSTRAQAF